VTWMEGPLTLSGLAAGRPNGGRYSRFVALSWRSQYATLESRRLTSERPIEDHVAG
jgi:hypothetical protein